MTPILYFLAMWCLPSEFEFKAIEGGHVTSFESFMCSAVGLWSGLIIGLVTEYYTSFAHGPVQKVAQASVSGGAPNII